LTGGNPDGKEPHKEEDQENTDAGEGYKVQAPPQPEQIGQKEQAQRLGEGIAPIPEGGEKCPGQGEANEAD